MSAKNYAPDSFIDEAMEHAIALAAKAGEKQNYPIAAVVFDDKGIIASASSNLVKDFDPSAHPELVAIRKACEIRQSRYLPGAVLATTLEPCPMCASAAIWAKMKGVAFATSQDDADAIGKRLLGTIFTFRQIHLRCDVVLNAGDPKLELIENVKRAEMMKVYNSFIKGLAK